MTATALVLGAAVRPDGSASPMLRRRVMEAARLYKSGEVSRLVLCGGVGRHGPSEASVMAGILRAEGVPVAALVLEDRSTDTILNISRALALCPDLRGACAPGVGHSVGPEVVIVTDVFHAPRARIIAAHLGLRSRASCPPPPRLATRVPACAREMASMLKVLVWMLTGYRLGRGTGC
ncbi:YdcF family protein [Oceanicola sp. S124]|uniref:YdcF family protein n=1 Tax=Oceanicola sp. S124 TaxID=1042378 RepID=UPI000255855B|nr:YdcF family protein [Oceanicola sp. S124]